MHWSTNQLTDPSIDPSIHPSTNRSIHQCIHPSMMWNVCRKTQMKLLITCLAKIFKDLDYKKFRMLAIILAKLSTFLDSTEKFLSFLNLCKLLGIWSDSEKLWEINWGGAACFENFICTTELQATSKSHRKSCCSCLITCMMKIWKIYETDQQNHLAFLVLMMLNNVLAFQDALDILKRRGKEKQGKGNGIVRKSL